VYVDEHNDNRRKLDHKSVGLFDAVRTDGHHLTVLVDGIPDAVSRDYVTWAPTRAEQETGAGDSKSPRDTVVPDGHGEAPGSLFRNAFSTMRPTTMANFGFTSDSGAIDLRRTPRNRRSSLTPEMSFNISDATTCC